VPAILTSELQHAVLGHHLAELLGTSHCSRDLQWDFAFGVAVHAAEPGDNHQKSHDETTRQFAKCSSYVLVAVGKGQRLEWCGEACG
jgi:hypothetical protein